jgi:hypothetical protein
LWKTKQDCKYQYHLNCWVLLLLLILCSFLKTILLHNSPKFSLSTIPCEPSIIKYLFCISRYYFKHFKPTRHRIYLPLLCCDFDISIYHSLQVLDLLYSILWSLPFSQEANHISYNHSSFLLVGHVWWHILYSCFTSVLNS